MGSTHRAPVVIGKPDPMESELFDALGEPQRLGQRLRFAGSGLNRADINHGELHTTTTFRSKSGARKAVGVAYVASSRADMTTPTAACTSLRSPKAAPTHFGFCTKPTANYSASWSVDSIESAQIATASMVRE